MAGAGLTYKAQPVRILLPNISTHARCLGRRSAGCLSQSLPQHASIRNPASAGRVCVQGDVFSPPDSAQALRSTSSPGATSTRQGVKIRDVHRLQGFIDLLSAVVQLSFSWIWSKPPLATKP